MINQPNNIASPQEPIEAPILSPQSNSRALTYDQPQPPHYAQPQGLNSSLSALSPSSSTTTAWSTALQSTLDHPPARLAYRLLGGGIVFCLAFGTWAYVGTVEEVGSARGQLIPQGEVYKVMPVQQGKVSDILVAEGDLVEAGQVMLRLDNRLDLTEIERLDQTLRSSQDQLNQTQILVEKTYLEIQSRQTSAQADMLAQTAAIEGARDNAATAQSLITQIQSEILAHQDRIQRLTSLNADGAISKEYLFDAEQSLLSRQQAMTQYQGDRQEKLSEIERLDAEQIKKRSEGQRYILEAQQRLQQLEVEITQLKANITETKNRLQGAHTKLENTVLHAPVDGVVLALNINNPDEVIQASQPIAEIAPQGVPLILSAKLVNRDAGFIQEGMTARIKFDAYPYQDYGTVEGKVIKIAPDTIKDDALGEVYKVEIALMQDRLDTEKGIKQFKPGQTATVDISIRQRRIIDILLDPFKQLQKGGLNL